MIEFLVALVAIFETWSMVGGQNHLDLMPGYTKLGLVVGLAVVTVTGSAAAVSHERAWKTIAWLLLALMIASGMGAATYYYHVHENDDQGPGSDDDSITCLFWPNVEPRR